MSITPANRAVMEITNELRTFAKSMPKGSQLPSTRDLMKRYRVGQASVQQAMESLEQEGLLVRRIGKGTFVATQEPMTTTRTIMILRSDYPSRRGDRITRELQNTLSKAGDQSLVITYSSMTTVVGMLKGAARPDAIILQPMTPSVPLDVIWNLLRMSDTLVVDHPVDGVNLDSIGIDWRDGLTTAVRHLQDLGHHRIALASGEPAQAWDQLARHFQLIEGLAAPDGDSLHGTVVTAKTEQGGSAARGMREATAQLINDNNGKLPFTAMIISSYASAVGAIDALHEHGINVPTDLSIVVLDNPDLGQDPDHVPLTMVGCSSATHAEALIELANKRIDGDSSQHGCVWQTPDLVTRASTQQLT
ncbi:substrate-binding domain-containing protein [Mucisphaera sp.]|uniref:substrate-binding domain-containing protein n=1 Tax=Mucisphaera sp. TaxID=2913024 RepID=UPI003D10515A